MFNYKNSRVYLRKLRMQKYFLIGLAGIIGSGILASYLNFHNEVARYTRSVLYRERQEATKEYLAMLKQTNSNRRLLSKNKNPERKFDE